MKKFIITLGRKALALGCLAFVLWSCNVDDSNSISQDDSDPANSHGVLEYLYPGQETFTFTGTSKNSNNIVTGTISINSAKSEAFGKLYLNGEFSHNFRVNISEEYLTQIGFIDNKDGTYAFSNVLEGSDNVMVKDFTGGENTTQLTMQMGQFEYQLNQSLGKQANGAKMEIPLLVVPIAIGGLAVVGTGVSCWFEREDSRNDCQNVYTVCQLTCNGEGESCQYSYEGGLCGGDCDVNCGSYDANVQ